MILALLLQASLTLPNPPTVADTALLRREFATAAIVVEATLLGDTFDITFIDTIPVNRYWKLWRVTQSWRGSPKDTLVAWPPRERCPPWHVCDLPTPRGRPYILVLRRADDDPYYYVRYWAWADEGDVRGFLDRLRRQAPPNQRL